jgi:hypothetical protein
MFVYRDAASVIFYDGQAKPIGDKEENLNGTYFKRMCPLPLAPSEIPVPCPSGTCDTLVRGQHRCLLSSLYPNCP